MGMNNRNRVTPYGDSQDRPQAPRTTNAHGHFGYDGHLVPTDCKQTPTEPDDRAFANKESQEKEHISSPDTLASLVSFT